MEIKNYKDLKQFCNSLTEEQLYQEVYLDEVEVKAIKIESAHISDVDRYFDHTDDMGTLDDIKAENPDDWQELILDYTIVPKGTVSLSNE